MYADIRPNAAFDRGFHLARTAIYIVRRVKAERDKTLYALSDLKFDPVPGWRYRKSLIKCHNDPTKPGFFKVDEVVRSRTVEGRKEYLCTFKNYPKSFKEWIPEDQFKKQKVAAPLKKK